MGSDRTPQPYTDADRGAFQLENFRRFGVQPPSSEYVTVDDALLVQAWAATTAASLQVSGRILTPEGKVQIFEQTLAVTVGGATPSTVRITGIEGFILSLSAIAPGAIRGQCFVSVVVQRGLGSSDVTRGHCLMQGYADAINAVGFPQGPLVNSLDGQGMALLVQPANPAAGADYSIAVPAGVTWYLKSAAAVFHCSAVAASRIPGIEFDDGSGNIFWKGVFNSTLTANALETVCFSQQTPLNVIGLAYCNITMPFGVRLSAGMLIRTITAAIDPGDNWLSGKFYVEQFIAP